MICYNKIVKIPTEIEKENLQKLYLACRGLLQTKIAKDIRIQKSLEETMYGFLGEDSWRPTHITKAAINEILNGSYRNVQRAHGILENKLDRYTRTMSILNGDEKSFDEWYSFYIQHDATVLITRKEHSYNIKFTKEELIEIPQELNLFGSVGFSFRFRKGNELKWVKSYENA
jgi:hypothetical protein